MRAYSQHDLLSVMPFGNYGELVDNQETPVKLVQAVARFASRSGITDNRCQELVQECLASSKDYSDRVGELKTVPGENKTRLIKRVTEVRKKLTNYN